MANTRTDDLSPKLYELSLDLSQTPVQGTLLISGNRKYRPSHRITLNQEGLKIQKVQLQTKRKNVVYELSIVRINYLPTTGQVRIHTKELVYPGEIELEIIFSSNVKPEEYKKIADLKQSELRSTSLRAYFPLVDNQLSKESSEFKIGYRQ